MNYWAGVFVGFMCSLLLMGIVCVVVTNRMSQYEKALAQLSHKHQELEAMYAEHERIMKAYEFYNWQYSLQMEDIDEDKQRH